MTTNQQTPEIAARIGGNLRALREHKELTQAELAARLQLAGMEKGSSPKTISAWERGETPLPLTAFPPLATAFRMSTDALARSLGLCGEPGPRELFVPLGADIMAALANETPAVQADIARTVEGLLAIARNARLARTT